MAILLGISCTVLMLSGCFLKPQKRSTIPISGPPSVVMEKTMPTIDSFLIERILKKHPEWFQVFLEQPENYRMQISYTQIDRDSSNTPHFTQYDYRPGAEYTYPASTVKLPAAVLALEKLNNLNVKGLTKDSYMFTEPLRIAEKPVFEDPSSLSGKPSVAQYIKKILLVSDNDAFNRIYEFVGQEAMNDRLQALGFTEAEMRHRLSMPLNDAENRLTNPVWFMDTRGNTLYRQAYQEAKRVYTPRDASIGKGYMASDPVTSKPVLMNKPLDFSNKNRWPVYHAHRMIQYLMFPESQPETEKLNLTSDDYSFLWKYMSMLPGESNYPNYNSADYWPAYVKFLLLGSEKGSWPDSNLLIFNKVGDAYGHLLDAAYIVDFDSKVEFILSAVIYCNKDGILNDDAYDYESVGFPFMKHLGEAVYEYEVQRPRMHLPDLSRFKMLPQNNPQVPTFAPF